MKKLQTKLIHLFQNSALFLAFLLFVGLPFGLILGLSESPVISMVVSSVLAILTPVLVVSQMSGSGKKEDHRAVQFIKSITPDAGLPLPFMGWLTGTSLGAVLGLVIRLNGLLYTPELFATQWESYIGEKRAVNSLFYLHYPLIDTQEVSETVVLLNDTSTDSASRKPLVAPATTTSPSGASSAQPFDVGQGSQIILTTRRGVTIYQPPEDMRDAGERAGFMRPTQYEASGSVGTEKVQGPRLGLPEEKEIANAKEFRQFFLKHKVMFKKEVLNLAWSDALSDTAFMDTMRVIHPGFYHAITNQ